MHYNTTHVIIYIPFFVMTVAFFWTFDTILLSLRKRFGLMQGEFLWSI